MNWDAIGAFGEIGGALAVVVTVVYLARQIRDNSKQVKLNTTQSYASLVQDAYASVYSNSQTIEAWITGTTDPQSLDSSQLRLYFLLMDRQLNNVVPLLNHYTEGAMSKQEFEHYRVLFQDLVASPGGQCWFGERAHLFAIALEALDDV